MRQTGHVDLIGTSAVLQELKAEVERVARSDAKVLITGESGVGKEIVARAIGSASLRAAAAFVPVNCAGIPETLLESELFGHLKGSFTGAYRDKPGKLEMASNGTIFLDEIGEMTLRMQGLLLRFLETGEIQKVGAERVATAPNVRVLAATNRNLRDLIAQGQFREDLFYRINVIHLVVPPLRERREDIPLLCDYFLDKFRQRYSKNVKTLAPSVYHLLIRNRWPGNVRELENAIERAVLVTKGTEIMVGDLPESIREESSSSADFVIPPHRTLAEIEKMAIMQTLQRTNWNKQEAAQILGLYRPTLYSKMKKHDIRDGGKRATAAAAAAANPPSPTSPS